MAHLPTIRALQQDDLDAVVKLDQAVSGRRRVEFLGQRFRALADDARAHLGLAAQSRGRVAGFALVHVLDGEFGGAAPVGVLDAIGVPAVLRREGVATALLKGLELALSGRGVRELRTQAEWTEHGIAAFFSTTGFRLSPHVVLERSLERPPADELPGEQLPVRSMAMQDLPAVVRLDRRITGRDRTAYLTRKMREALGPSVLRVSLVAEVERQFAGFLMARVDFGEFGRTEPTAILDTLGVDPAFAGKGVGRALVGQLLRNLGSLRTERVVTEVEWNHLPLLGFLGSAGFTHSQRLAFQKAIG